MGVQEASRDSHLLRFVIRLNTNSQNSSNLATAHSDGERGRKCAHFVIALQTNIVLVEMKIRVLGDSVFVL